MAKTRYIMIGGFLGAGKTTAILKLADYLARKGLRSGLITNDQSVDLVDTARVRAAGYTVEEITGGCFCCKFDSLIATSRQLTCAITPDVLIAEPVGSCTDLKATVSYPLRQMCGKDYQVAPLSVLVDPTRCARTLGLCNGKDFSDKVLYVYRKQLEEAEIVVVNKIDLLETASRERLVAALAEQFPRAQIMQVSCMTGEGLEAWFDRLIASDLGNRQAMEVDYDEYADGEARLGWLNARAGLSNTAAIDGNRLLLDLAERLKTYLASQNIEIAHLKMTLAPSETPDLAAVSLTRSDDKPSLTHTLKSPLSAGELTVNLRAEADPELLERDVIAALDALRLKSELQVLAAFRPGRPNPTYRIATPTVS